MMVLRMPSLAVIMLVLLLMLLAFIHASSPVQCRIHCPHRDSSSPLSFSTRAAAFIAEDSNITTSLPYNTEYKKKFKIKNDGNVPEAFSLNAQVPAGSPFIASVEPETTQIVWPTKTAECTLTITFSGQIPEDISTGSTFTVSVSATGQIMGEKSSHTFTVIVNFPVMRVTYFTLSKESVREGDSVTVRASVENAGNIDFRNGYVRLAIDDTVVMNDTGEIKPNSTKNYSVNIKVRGEGPHIIYLKVGYGKFVFDERQGDVFAEPRAWDLSNDITYIAMGVGVALAATMAVLWLRRYKGRGGGDKKTDKR